MVSEAEQIRGMITYPCCPHKKAVVKYNAHGCAIHPCPNCGKYIEFIYDSMEAKIVKPFRGASKKFRKYSE